MVGQKVTLRSAFELCCETRARWAGKHHHSHLYASVGELCYSNLYSFLMSLIPMAQQNILFYTQSKTNIDYVDFWSAPDQLWWAVVVECVQCLCENPLPLKENCVRLYLKHKMVRAIIWTKRTLWFIHRVKSVSMSSDWHTHTRRPVSWNEAFYTFLMSVFVHHLSSSCSRN